MAFLSQQFHYNKKTSCSAFGGGVGVVVSTDIGVDDIAENTALLR